MLMWISSIVAKDGYSGYYVADKKPIDLAIMIVITAFTLFTIIFYYPSVVFMFVLDTNIQMMKKRDYIEQVIKEQKHQKALRSMRMYQAFKLIRRELIDYFAENVGDKKLRALNINLLRENYSIITNGRNRDLSVMQLLQFYPLCGNNLKKLESYILLKKANSEGDTISFEDLMIAIEKTTNDVKVDPYDAITTIFLLLMKEKHKLSVEEIKGFFSEYEDYFEREDIDEFMDEILSIQRKGALINIQEIASLIRDDIECFPR